MKNDKEQDESGLCAKCVKKTGIAKSLSRIDHLEKHRIKCQEKHGVNDPRQSKLNFTFEDRSLTTFTIKWHARVLAIGQLPLYIENSLGLRSTSKMHITHSLEKLPKTHLGPM